jgi:hypothetical protein
LIPQAPPRARPGKKAGVSRWKKDNKDGPRWEDVNDGDKVRGEEDSHKAASRQWEMERIDDEK